MAIRNLLDKEGFGIVSGGNVGYPNAAERTTLVSNKTYTADHNGWVIGEGNCSSDDYVVLTVGGIVLSNLRATVAGETIAYRGIVPVRRGQTYSVKYPSGEGGLVPQGFRGRCANLNHFATSLSGGVAE